MRSDKGGKRPKGSRKDYDFNPCYCNSTIANCYTKLDSKKKISRTIIKQSINQNKIIFFVFLFQI